MFELSTNSGTMGRWNCPWCGNYDGAVNIADLEDDAPLMRVELKKKKRKKKNQKLKKTNLTNQKEIKKELQHNL